MTIDGGDVHLWQVTCNSTVYFVGHSWFTPKREPNMANEGSQGVPTFHLREEREGWKGVPCRLIAKRISLPPPRLASRQDHEGLPTVVDETRQAGKDTGQAIYT